MSSFAEPKQKCTGKISDIKLAIDTCGGKSSHDGFTSLVSRGILCGNVSSINRFPDVLEKIKEKKESMTINKDYVDTLKSCFGLFSEEGDKCDDIQMSMSDDEDTAMTSGESLGSVGECSEDNIAKLQTNCDKNTLIREYCTFLREYDNVTNETIYSEFTTMCNNDEGFKDFNPNNEPAASFMLTMIFCWKYAGVLMKAKETSTTTGGQKGGDGEDKLVRYDLSDHEGYNKHRRRIMIALSLFAQIFFLFLLFEQFRLLFTTIERILEVAADFNNDTGHTVLGFFDAAQQILLGNMVSTLLMFQGVATSRIQESIRSIAIEGQRTVHASYYRGFATAVNDYLTGSSIQFVKESAAEEAKFQQQILLQEGIHEINVKFNNLTMETQSLTYGIINGLQGFMTSSILLIHYVDPNIVNAGQVTQAVGALTTSFAAPASWANMVALVNNVRLATGSTIGLIQGGPGTDTDSSIAMDVVEKDGGKKKRKRTQKRTQTKKKGGQKKRKRTQKKKKGGKKKSTRKRK